MRKVDFGYTLFVIFVGHFIISVFMALAFGTSHPFANMYIAGRPIPYIVAGCLLAVPVYMLLGYFFILGKEYLNSMDKVSAICSFIFLLVLTAGYFTCYFLTKYYVVRGAWMYYVIFNYPTGVMFNTISLNADALNLWFLLTVVPGPLGFYIGSLMRYRYESILFQKGRKQ